MNEPYPWQQAEWTHLHERAAHQRLPHALLVTGPVGVGKRGFITAFAHALLCKRPTDAGLACAQCEACLLLKAGTHPDFRTVSVLEDKTQIGIDQIRALSRVLGMKSHSGGYKIAIVQPADHMTIEAANSLLKTLEEPTDNTVLILITEHIGRLSATIRSRCQLLRFPAPAVEQGLAWLNTQPGVVASDLLLRLADAAPLQALSLSQDDIVGQRRAWLEQLIGMRRDAISPITSAAEWAADTQSRPLYWFISFLKDLVRLSYSGNEFLKNIDLADLLNVIVGEVSRRDLLSALSRAEQTQQLTQHAGINRQLLLEALLIEWSRAGRSRRARA